MLLTVPASAHDALSDSTPAAGDTLTEVPSELALTFTGEISDLGVQFVVTGPDGRDVVQGTPTVDGVTVTQPLAAELVNGDYQAAWRVTSSDGHPISGTIDFTIDAEATSGDGAAATTGDDPTGAATDTGAPTETGAATETETGSDTATQAPTDSTTSAPGPTAGETPDQAAPTVTQAPSTTQGSTDGIPTWGWLVAGLAAVGLVACGFLAFRRN